MYFQILYNYFAPFQVVLGVDLGLEVLDRGRGLPQLQTHPVELVQLLLQADVLVPQSPDLEIVKKYLKMLRISLGKKL